MSEINELLDNNEQNLIKMERTAIIDRKEKKNSKPVPAGLQLMEISEYKKKFGFFQRRKANKKTSAYLIKIIHPNNTTSMFVINTTGPTFLFRKATYFIDADAGLHNSMYQMLELEYFEGHPEPLRKKHRELFAKINSYSLTRVLRFEYAKVLMQASSLKKQVDLTLIFAAIGMFVGLINLVFMTKLLGIW